MKSVINFVVTQYLRIRWDKIQSTAAFVVLFGLGLVGANFWDLAWQFVFEPAGFQRDGFIPAIIGLILVFMGLTTLVIDRFATRLTPPTLAQDKAIFNKALRVFEWHEIDTLLDDLTAKHFRSSHSSKLRELEYFLKDTRHRFNTPEMKSAAENLYTAIDALSSHMGLNFTGPNRPESEFIDWNYNKHSDYGDSDWPKYKEKSSELKTVSDEFEKACQDFFKTGNRLGLVEVL